MEGGRSKQEKNMINKWDKEKENEGWLEKRRKINT